MYEASFGLKRRPFAATPDATCFLASGPIQAALDELIVCVEQGQGIAVLTAPAGTGKTLLCERLRFELDDRFETVFLRHASFLTRRALLQTVLCELNSTYNHPSEHELRLELLPAIRALQPKREALVLICDEAHQLNDSLLEELRILADFAEAGRPLVRLVLVGQPSLEEKLTQPSLEAFNQRIRAQIHLNTFNHAESLDYIDYRITWSGGRTHEVFSPEALDLIVSASDGVPRCINQLADHSLLLAFVAEQRPVSADLVHEALSDLRQLPLHWNEPVQRSTFSDETGNAVEFDDRKPAYSSQLDDTLDFVPAHSSETGAYSYEPESELAKTDSFEIHIPSQVTGQLDSQSQPAVGRTEMDGDEWRKTIDAFDPQKSVAHEINLLNTDTDDDHSPVPADTSKFSRRIQFHDLLKDAYEAAAAPRNAGESHGDFNDQSESGVDSIELLRQSLNASREASDSRPNSEEAVTSTNLYTVPLDHFFHEEMIVDRYTAIDAGLEPPKSCETDTNTSEQVRHSFDDIGQSDDEFVEEDTVELTIHQEPHHDSNSLDGLHQIASDLYSLADSMRPQGGLSSNSESILEAIRQEVPSIGNFLQQESSIQPPPVPESAAWESIETPVVETAEPNRPFRFLFSKLRRKQQGL